MNKIRLNQFNSTIFALVICSCAAIANSFSSNKKTAVAISQGVLTLVANGEDFVREGFVSKDDWEIDFSQVTVNVGEVTAYQVKSGFNPEQNDLLEPQVSIPLVESVTAVDLATEIDNPPAVTVKQSETPEGFYNALSWSMIPQNEGDFQAQTIVLQGKATKDEAIVNFQLGFALPMEYLCGEFIGDTRKGFVNADTPGEIEMTFHFDHIFGDGEAPMDDAINRGALGFQPLADIAQDGTVVADWQTLEQKLTTEEIATLTNAVAGLGHVGEGHCKATYRP